MPKSSPSPFIPPLTPEEIEDRDHQEKRLDKKLRECGRDESFDIERAFQVMRAYAVEIFRVVYPAYRKKPGYATDWLPVIVNETIHRVLVTSEGYVRYEIRDLTGLGNELERTLINHLKGDPTHIAPSDVEEAFPRPKQAPRSLSPPPPSGPPLPPEIQAQMNSPSVREMTPPTQSDPAIKPSLGDELRRLLTEARIRPEDIAEEIGIEPRNVYRHLAGTTHPSLVNIGKYEKALSRHLRKPVHLPTSVKRR